MSMFCTVKAVYTGFSICSVKMFYRRRPCCIKVHKGGGYANTNLHVTHTHSPMAENPHTIAGLAIGGNVVFSVLPKDILTCGQEEVKIKPPTLRSVDDSLTSWATVAYIQHLWMHSDLNEWNKYSWNMKTTWELFIHHLSSMLPCVLAFLAIVCVHRYGTYTIISVGRGIHILYWSKSANTL